MNSAIRDQANCREGNKIWNAMKLIVKTLEVNSTKNLEIIASLKIRYGHPKLILLNAFLKINMFCRLVSVKMI